MEASSGLPKNKKTVENLLSTWYNKSVRLVTGMMRQTPTVFLKYFGGLPSFTKQHIKLTHNYIHSRLAAPETNPFRRMVCEDLVNVPATHQSPQKKFLGKDSNQTTPHQGGNLKASFNPSLVE
ncbi:hypothetical protein O181_011490 [Austropuccinia psidii MF-1]|uniref:Uncharacterized protein n=1 Tax=Austropuccinia psidii MF-1 TaxID=1389203 RepID=A0A9Q3GLY8_9BASI|nr:hypothetical protein [Austropuccinia psidii MF-1]